MTISAMLLLSSAMAHAQEVVLPPTAEPVISEPAVTQAAPAAATATIVLPTVEASPIARPVEAPATTTSAVTPPAVSRNEAAPERPAPRAAQRTAPSPTRNGVTPAAPSTTPVSTTASMADTEPVTPPPLNAQGTSNSAIAPVAPSAPESSSDGSDWALPIGVGASILVLGVAVITLRRRRRPYEEDVDFVPPVIVPPARAEGRPPMAARMAAMQPPVMPRPAGVMPTVAPAGAREREALIERMVAAAPDASNPFTSRKARRRRAKLIMQSMPDAAMSQPAAVPARAETIRPAHPPMARMLVDA